MELYRLSHKTKCGEYVCRITMYVTRKKKLIKYYHYHRYIISFVLEQERETS